MILAKRPRRIPQQETHPQHALQTIYKHMRLWRRTSGHPPRAGTHEVGPRLRPHQTQHQRRPRTTHHQHGQRLPKTAQAATAAKTPLPRSLRTWCARNGGGGGVGPGCLPRQQTIGHCLASALWPMAWCPTRFTGLRRRRWGAEAPKTRPLGTSKTFLINLCSTRASPDRQRWPAWPPAPTA